MDSTSGKKLGLTLTQQATIGSDVDVTLGDTSPAEFWRDLATSDGFQQTLVESIRDIATDVDATPATRFDVVEALYDAGVTGLSRMYATVAASLIRPEDDHHHEAALDVTAAYGQGEKNAIATFADLDELDVGPIAVLGERTSPVTVQIDLRREFFDRRADHRKEICRTVLAPLASACELQLVASPIVQRRLAKKHSIDLPGDVKSQCSTSHADGPLLEQVEDALDEFNADGRPVQFLECLASEDTESLRYGVLQDELNVSRKSMTTYLKQLQEDYEFVMDYHRGQYKHIELTQTGREFVNAIADEKRTQASLSDYREINVKSSRNPSSHNCVPPGKHGKGERRRDKSAAAAEYQGRTDRYGGIVQTEWLSGEQQAAIRGVSTDGGVVVVDRSTDGYDDTRNHRLGYDDTADDVMVSLEYTTPVSYLVGAALTLTSGSMFQRVLSPSRLDGNTGCLGGLDVDNQTVLRDGLCVGWLPDRVEAGEDLVAELRGVHERVLDMTSTLKQKERDSDVDQSEYYAYRGEVMRYCHGVIGTMAALLDQADITPRYELRIPDSNQNVIQDDFKRARFVETLSRTIAIQSRYKAFAVNRQLYENREEKRAAAISPDVDAANPVGEFIGSIAIVAKNASSVTDDLRTMLADPDTLHDDAPDIAVPVPVEEASRTATGRAAGRVLGQKNLRPTRESVSLLHGLTESPYDAARALYALGGVGNPVGRELDQLYVRYALTQLSWTRLLPGVDPGMKKIVAALLRSDTPFVTQQELAAAADVTAKTVGKHKIRLQELNLIRETAAGWTFTLPLPDARNNDDDARILPEYVADDLVAARDVLYEVAVAFKPDDDRVHGLDWRGDLEPLFDILPWLQPWVDILRGLCRDPESDPAVVTFGQTTDQSPLPGMDPNTTKEAVEVAQ